MASYRLSNRKDLSYQSPAKIFAKLKSEVQKEAENILEQQGRGADTRLNLNTDGVCRAGGPGHKPNPAGFCWSEELKENNRLACYQAEAQPLTLSPISSPEKSFESSANLRLPLQEEFPLNDTVRGSARRTGSIMESTAVSKPDSVPCRDQITAGLSRIQSKESCRRRVFNQEAVPLNPRSPGSVYSPMKKRLRKRKLDPHDSKNANRTTKEISEDLSSPPTRRKPAVLWDSAQNTSRLDRGPIVKMNRVSMMSPAKLFALMKESERKKEHQQIQTSSRRELFMRNERSLKESRCTEVSTNPHMNHIEAAPLMNTTEQVAPVNQNRAASPESPSEISEDTVTPPSPAPRVLLEDPLILNSPQISIPKKDKEVFRRNVWTTQKQFPLESVIHLRKWFLRRNRRGLFVDGIHVEENIQWNSNIITQRVSRSVLKTVTGRVYILVGQMSMNLTSDFPRWFLKKFVNGFPSNWETLYQTFLSGSKEHPERNSEDTVISAKNESELPSRNQSVRRKNAKRSQSCPSSSCSSLNVTRSGRVIKPPLEYWKGGRVFLDAQMNVTVHMDYNSSSPDAPKTDCSRRSKKPAPLFSPCSDGLNRQESAKDKEFSAPVRRVKADRTLDRVETNRHQNPADSSSDCQKVVPGRRMSKQLRSDVQKRLCLDAGPQQQGEPESASSERSKRRTRNASRLPTRTLETVTRFLKSPSTSNKTSNPPLSDNESLRTGRRRERAGHATRSMAVVGKSESDHRVSPKRAPEAQRENRKEQKRKSRAATRSRKVQENKKEGKSTKSSPQELSSQATQPGARRRKGGAAVPKESDGDEWTEDEILKLEEAVCSYPKHTAGYWAKVARMVGTRTAEECYKQHTSHGATQSPTKSTKKGKEKAAKPAVDCGSVSVPVISARAGTLKRKRQVRQFLETVPKEDVDDAFSSTHMQKKLIEIPSLCSSEDHDFSTSDLEPQTPMSSCYPEVKTPRCLDITPGMIGSSNTNDDQYVYQLQKRMRKNQFDFCKASSFSRKYAATPSAKQAIRKCGNTENFIVWEMLPGDKAEISESDEEEEDFYFSDN